jgi:hypothetical protein
MASKKYKDNGDKRGNKPFTAMRHDVMDSYAWANTSMKGIKLIMDMTAQYRGNNNGDLSLAWKLMKPRGWKSEGTLNDAKDELMEKQWLIRTRKGSRNVCALYALTFFAVDASDKYDPDIRSTLKPRDSWKAGNVAPDIVEEKRKERARKIKVATTEIGVRI